jgi:hypothetical protein
MLQIRPSEPSGRIIEGFTTCLDLINLEQVEKLVQRALNRKIQEAISPNILDLAFCMDCTSNYRLYFEIIHFTYFLKIGSMGSYIEMAKNVSIRSYYYIIESFLLIK